MKTYILFHQNCQDGFGSAFAAWKHFGSSATYIPVSHGNPPPEIPEDSLVYILDFSYPREILENLNKRMAKLQVIDHHKTAEEDLRGLPYCIFDMNKSGALLSFEYFHGIEDTGPLHRQRNLIRYISDRDLWKFELPASKEVNAALSSYPKYFEVWDTLDTEYLAKEGEAILRHIDTTVNLICEHVLLTSKFKHLGYDNIPIVNSPAYVSDVGARLRELFPDAPFVCSYYHKQDVISKELLNCWSLRCKEDFDVTPIAKAFVGGGHKQAAGFTERLVL